MSGKIKIIKKDQAAMIRPEIVKRERVPLAEIRNTWLKDAQESIAARRLSDIRTFYGAEGSALVTV